MANPEHLAILKQGVEAWNQWREENPKIRPDLRGADLRGTDLRRVDLRITDLRGADLRDANLESSDMSYAKLKWGKLSGAILKKTDMYGADLSKTDLDNSNLDDADLREADLRNALNLYIFKFRKAQINGRTKFSKSNVLVRGVNGVYDSFSSVVVIFRLEPPADSMLSSNPESIIESLKSARKLHDFSFALAGVAVLILVMGLKSIPLPFFTQIHVDPVHFLLIAVLFSAGLLILAESFMHSAYEAAQYIDSRDSAMKIGHFPWSLSKYDKRTYGKWITTLFRVFLCAHPLVYAYFLYTLYPAKGIYPVIIDMNYMDVLVFFVSVLTIYLTILIYGVRIFWLSQQFQKPILFDPETERNRKSDAAILNTEVAGLKQEVSRLNKNVTTLIDILKPKPSATTNLAEDASTNESSS
jgi:hypothetical protein